MACGDEPLLSGFFFHLNAESEQQHNIADAEEVPPTVKDKGGIDL